MKFYKEENFKEIDGLKVPKDWEVVKLGKIITLKNGKRPIFDEMECFQYMVLMVLWDILTTILLIRILF